MNDIPIFKAKDAQTFDDWLEQINKMAALTNKDPYKLALAISQGSFNRNISSFCPLWDGTKLKNDCIIILVQYLPNSMQHPC